MAGHVGRGSCIASTEFCQFARRMAWICSKCDKAIAYGVLATYTTDSSLVPHNLSYKQDFVQTLQFHMQRHASGQSSMMAAMTATASDCYMHVCPSIGTTIASPIHTPQTHPLGTTSEAENLG